MDNFISPSFPCAQHSFQRADSFNLMEFCRDASSLLAILRMTQSCYLPLFCPPSLLPFSHVLAHLFPFLAIHSFRLCSPLSFPFLSFPCLNQFHNIFEGSFRGELILTLLSALQSMLKTHQLSLDGTHTHSHKLTHIHAQKLICVFFLHPRQLTSFENTSADTFLNWGRKRLTRWLSAM